MNILFIGDISGRPGRETIQKLLPEIKRKHNIQFVIANAENAAGGRGVTKKVLNELISYGIDFFTSGEHIWDIKEFRSDLEENILPIVRPLNYEHQETLPGTGIKEVDLGKAGKLIIISLLGQTFMREPVRSPFWVMDEILNKNLESWKHSAIIIDFHAEATSEKISLAYYLKNKITALVGTHTHVATADTRIIDNTGFVTDVGMVGPLNASLWVEFGPIIHNFKFPYKESFKIKKNGPTVFNSVLLEIDEEESDFGIKKCKKIFRIDRTLNSN